MSPGPGADRGDGVERSTEPPDVQSASHPPDAPGEGQLQVGDRVMRLGWKDKRPIYEATVAEIVPVDEYDRETGEKRSKILYRLDREDGTPSPVTVKANALRRVK